MIASKVGNVKDVSFFLKDQSSKTKRLFNNSLSCTKNFRIEFLSNILSQIKISSNDYHIDLKSFKSIFQKLKNNELKVINADKNVGTVIIDNNIYTKLCFEHLDDIKTYKMINHNLQFELFNKSKNILCDLNKSNHISDKLFKCLYKSILFKKTSQF